MTSYQNRNQIQTELQQMLPHQIQECKTCDELPKTLEELIKHNFQATFVCYDKKKGTIEVGVEKELETDSYPEIKVHTIKLEEAASRLKKTFRHTDQDLKFYGKLLAGYASGNPVDDVVLV